MPIKTEDLLAERDMLRERVDQLEAVLRCLADDVEEARQFSSNRGGQQVGGCPVLYGCKPSTIVYLARLLRHIGIKATGRDQIPQT